MCCIWVRAISGMYTDWEKNSRAALLRKGPEKLNMSQHGILAALKANCILGCIEKRSGSTVREGIFPLYPAFMKPSSRVLHPGLGLPAQEECRDLLEQVQRRVTRMIKGLKHQC